jgi:ABC-2 type transport system permease protein
MTVTRRIVDQFRRDHRTLGLMFIVPLVVTALLGWVVRDSTAAETRLAIVNADGPPGTFLANALRDAAASGTVVVSDGGSDPGAARTLIVDDKADLVLVIPAGFGEDVVAGVRPVLRIVAAGVEPANDAGRAAAVQQLLASAIEATLPAEAAARVPRIEREAIYLPADADALDALAPILLGYFAYFFVFILTGISFLRERIGGTLERLLATPVTRGEIVLGYGLGFGLFATLQVLVLTAFVLMRLEIPAIGPLPAFTIGLDVPSAGNPLLAFLVALTLAIGAVNLGIFLSTFARTELQILQFIPVVIVPQGLLSGIFWPVDTLPDLLQPIARVLPLTYAVDGLRDVMIRGLDLSAASVQRDLAVLAAIALFFVVLAARTIRREIA